VSELDGTVVAAAALRGARDWMPVDPPPLAIYRVRQALP
jgi:hypothetical protein